jgi:hypothetical protein
MVVRVSPARWVRLYLDDGEVLYGWPECVSRDRKDAATEIFLTRVQRRRPNEDWVDLPDDVTGVWVDASRIKKIVVTSFTFEKSNEQASEEAQAGSQPWPTP